MQKNWGVFSIFYRELLASGTSNSNSGDEDEKFKVKGVESTELQHRHHCQTKRISVIEKNTCWLIN